MDEAVAGHASRIEVTLEPGNRLTVTDNGRGIPVDPHPKYPGKSALEVIMTTLHSGGKFEGKAYSTSGGLHGVGVSVVNALSTETDRRGRARQEALPPDLRAGASPTSKLEEVGAAPNRRGTTVTFTPDPEIFGADAAFSPERLYKLARSKAYLFAGVEIRWRCDPSLASDRRAREAPSSSSPAASPTISPSSSATGPPSPTSRSPAARTSPTTRAAPNGRSPGRSIPTAAKAITATPSRRPTAAPTRRACAPR